MKTTPRALTRRVGAGVAVGALAVSSLALTSPAQAANKIITSILVDQSETRSTGHNVFGDDGVRVYTEGSTSTDKAAGYFDAHVSLAAAGEPSMSWSANAGQTSNLKPSVQLKVDFDNDNDIDGILVGEPTYADGTTLYGNDWWLSNGSDQVVKDAAPSHTGGSGSDNHGTLAQWRTAFPNADILQSGWSLGSGVKGDGTINSITVCADKYYFTQGDAVQNVKLYASDVDTSSTREKGHNEFRPTSGVNVYTDPIVPGFPGDAGHYEGYVNKAAGFFPIDELLSAVGEPTMEFRTNSGSIPPGLWLNLDIDGDGDADGTLIKERAYGNDWWLNDTSGPLATFAPTDGGGSGSNLHGDLSEWRASLPAGTRVVTSGWSLGGGVEGDFIVDHITVGLKRFGFSGANQAPTAAPVTGTVQAGAVVVVDLNGADADGDPLTYSATGVHGTAAINNATGKLTFTADKAYIGTASFSYSVSDGKGGSDSSTVSLDVTKASSTTAFTLSPAQQKSTIVGSVAIQVTSTGSVTAGKVDVYVDRKLVNSGKVYSTGKTVLSLKSKLSKGTHTVSVYYRGTEFSNASFKGKTFTVN
ncbi:MAG: Ig-like domain-containing protein [Aeromicrobium sp.]